MIASVTDHDTAADTGRALIAAGLLLTSAFVLANDDARLQISPAYGEILSDDIYQRAEGWRQPPLFESEWRPPKPEPKSRIRFGYDSAYEEMRARNAGRDAITSLNLRDPRPAATQFRLEY